MNEIQYDIRPVELDTEDFKSIVDQLYPETLQMFMKAPPKQGLVEAFVLKEGGQVLGRFCLYYNPEIVVNGEMTLQLGGYECIDDLEVSTRLINSAKNRAKAMGGKHLIGPMNGSTWQHYRFTVNDNQSFFFLEHIHQFYYPKQFKHSGFSELASYASFYDANIKLNPERMIRYKTRFEKTNYKIRPINLLNFDAELKRICQFSNASFKDNYLFAPKDETEFIDLFKSLKDLIVAELFWLCEDENNAVQAILFCMPDYLNTRNDTIVVKTIAKLDKPDLNGIVSYMSEYIYTHALKLGYTKAIHAYFKDSNKSKQLSEKYNGSTYKSHCLYQMTL